MTEEDREQRSEYLRAMIESPGGTIFFKHIEDEIVSGWESFISLPVTQKTSKAAFNHQAKYEVLKNLKEWVQSEIRLGSKDFRNP